MSDVMTISVAGKGASCLIEQFDAAGIEYEKWKPTPGRIYASAGDILHVLHESAPYAAIATVLVAWLRGLATRAVTITTQDNNVVYVKGFGVKQLEEILRVAKRVDAIEITKRQEIEPTGPRLHIESDEE